MKFALLIYDENTANPAPNPDPAIGARVMDEYNAFTKAITDAGVYVGGEALQPNPTGATVRVRDGQAVTTDGPFMETKEGLGGFYVLDTKDRDEALEWAAKCPGSWYGSVEVRPLVTWEEYDSSEIEHTPVGSSAS